MTHTPRPPDAPPRCHLAAAISAGSARDSLGAHLAKGGGRRDCTSVTQQLPDAAPCCHLAAATSAGSERGSLGARIVNLCSNRRQAPARSLRAISPAHGRIRPLAPPDLVASNHHAPPTVRFGQQKVAHDQPTQRRGAPSPPSLRSPQVALRGWLRLQRGGERGGEASAPMSPAPGQHGVRNITLTLIEREDDTRSWGNFLVYFSLYHNDMPSKGLGIHTYRLLARQEYARC
jgi:hypothetical protein